VIGFDVASQVPPGARIDSVALILNVASAPNDTPRVIALHRLLSDWGEGASVSSGGRGAPSDSGDATWRHTFYDTDFWTTPGGDFVSAATASRLVDPSGSHTWSSSTMTADVQLWLDDPNRNFGWILIGEESSVSTVRRFDSRENGAISNRPQLVIHFTHDAAPPPALRLAPSYPNPFVEETRIDFEVPGTLQTRIDVFDARGRRVATLVDRIFSGRGYATWDGRNRAGAVSRSGVYFLRLTANGRDRLTRKVVFLR